jgi:predicted PurR-regulated permease PerM
MQKAVELPASLLMLAQVFMYYWAGLLGVALAPPLAAMAIKLVQMLYLQDYLGDPLRRDKSFWPEGAERGPE